MHDQNHYWTERALAFAVSVGMHIALVVVVLGMTKPPLEPMSENIKVELVNLSLPEPTETSKPEPPKPEPPAPEPPKPEPPAPEPPKPEPPKPEPPKPEPPKPPVPKPQVITTPAPTPKPPAPTPKPPAPTPKPPTPIKSLKERLKEAEVKKQPGQPSPRPAPRNVPSQEELKKKLIRAAGPSTASPTASSVNAPYTAQQIRESSNYAEKVVGPYLYQRWEQPTRSELGATPVRPVEVSFTVYANGTVANVVIAGDNNNQALVRSIRNLFADIRSMPPLSTVGSNAASLRIVVVMTLTSN